jgi:hypothetical protein
MFRLFSAYRGRFSQKRRHHHKLARSCCHVTYIAFILGPHAKGNQKLAGADVDKPGFLEPLFEVRSRLHDVSNFLEGGNNRVEVLLN